MKKLLLTLSTMVVALLSFAQAPNLFNYQGVARNAAGNVIPNQSVGLRLSILSGSATGTAVYVESRTVVTNAFGLFNVQVGGAGAISTTGTIAGVNWSGIGGAATKFLQVEIDPTGGTNYVNVGSTQLLSVPYALTAAGAAPIGTAGGDLTGSYPNPTITTNAVTTPKIADGAVTTAKITFPVVKTQSDAGPLVGMTNSGAGDGIQGINTGTGRGGYFQVNNTASTADALRGETNGTGASWGVRGISTGTNGAGLFQQTNAANTSNNLQSNQAGLGRAGFFNSTNAASGAAGLESNVAGTGAAIRAVSTNATPSALQTVGGVQLTGIGEGLNKVLVSDAAGNATWQSVAAGGAVTGSGTLNFIPKWTPSGTVLGNSLLFDNGTNVGINNTAPAYALDITHSGANGAHVKSTAAFSVVDIDAANGDAALRYQAAGATKWNVRNAPGSNDYQIVRNNSLPANLTINNGTGFIGITQATPAYQLDVLHAGATGIRSQSSASFSVMDIDASNGDAALRFQKAGVGKWNTRNRPADDYYEWFELGGGGSRMVIQAATGNVGIGETTNPTYRLDVLHGGATGIRSKSSSTFSVIDIDAANGDAALRFASAGVNQWNMRNRPADNYLEWFELGGGGSRMVIQDGTGNVGIGETTNPTYRLDVLHGGATGIRSRSSSTFSVIDIDAANGDAALRLARAGVNQWNLRNRPADDYFEIFELGGGGSRMVIQDGTGNVGIGQTTNPTYKLDVLHGGATGLRVQSSSTFSVIDIDGQNGDAALRFVKAGVNQWNTRNNPATNDYQIFELGGGGERLRIEDGTGKVVVNGDFTALGTKLFTMDHPLDPENKTLAHAAVESNEVMNLYSGNVTTDASGKVTVTLPDYFEAINKDFRYQLTVVGGTFAQAIISKEISNNKFEIATNQPNVKVSWEVKGVRNDARMRMNPFNAVQDKPAAQRGKYLDPKSHNQPESKGVSYDANLSSSVNDTKPTADKKVAPPTTGGSLDQGPITAPSVAKADNSGSVSNVTPAKPADKKLPIDGSVAPDTKKQDVKPVAKPTGAQSIND